MSAISLQLGASNVTPATRSPIRSHRIGDIFIDADTDIKVSFMVLPSIQSLEVKGALFSVLMVPQIDGGVVVRTSTNSFNASGQGRNKEEALQNIKSAIELLLEEEASPSGDVAWPEDFR